MDGKNVEMSGREEERVKAESWRLKRPTRSHTKVQTARKIEFAFQELERQIPPMSPIATIQTLSPSDIRKECKEMRAYARKLAADKPMARKFFRAVQVASGQIRPARAKKRVAA
jgi:hypothetical protein